MSNFSPRAARRARALTWVLLVGISIVAAGMAATSPKGQQRLAMLLDGASGAQAPAFWSAPAADISRASSPDVEQRLAAMEASLQRLQGKTVESVDRIKDLTIAFAGLKEQLGQVTGSVATSPATTVLERRQSAPAGTPNGSIDVRMVPLDGGGIAEADRANDVPDAPIITPMVNLAVPSPAIQRIAPSGAPVPIPVPTVTVTDFGIELTRAATIDELEREWRRLSKSQKKAMARLEPRISLDFSSSGTAKLVLIAGPIRNAGDAARLCAMLAAAGERCRTVPFGEDTVALNGQP